MITMLIITVVPLAVAAPSFLHQTDHPLHHSRRAVFQAERERR